jgi:hypothetical protein
MYLLSNKLYAHRSNFQSNNFFYAFSLSKNDLCMWNTLLWKIKFSSMLHTFFAYEIL